MIGHALGRLADAPTREEVRNAATEVFHGNDLLRHKSLWQRFLEWLADQLRISDAPSGPAAPPSGGASLLAWVLVIAAVLAVIAMIVVVARNWVRREKVPQDDLETESDDERSTAEWRADADRYESEGFWKEALRARYRELVGELVDRGALSPQAGRTTGEFRLDVAEAVPQVAGSFDGASLLFELAWYGHVETGPDENARFKALAGDVLERAQVDRAVRDRLVSVGAEPDAWEPDEWVGDES